MRDDRQERYLALVAFAAEEGFCVEWRNERVTLWLPGEGREFKNS